MSNTITNRVLAITGLSLRDLSALLDLNPSQLSRYRQQTHTLPTDALLKLAKISTQLHNLPAIEPPVLTVEEKAYLLQRAQHCRLQIAQLQTKLSAIKENYQQAATMLLLLPLLAEHTDFTTTKKQRWIEEQQYQAEKKLKANGPLVQSKLVIEIGGLEEVVRMCEEEL